MLSSINQITKAFNACIISTAAATCAADGTINSTLNSQPGVTITASAHANANCFEVTANKVNGCVALNDKGSVNAKTVTPNADTGNMNGDCDSSNGTCTP